MSPELNSLLGLLVVGVIFLLIGRALTATSRRRGAMEALASKLQCDYQARANDALAHYAGFATTQSTTQPRSEPIPTETPKPETSGPPAGTHSSLPFSDKGPPARRHRCIVWMCRRMGRLPRYFQSRGAAQFVDRRPAARPAARTPCPCGRGRRGTPGFRWGRRGEVQAGGPARL